MDLHRPSELISFLNQLGISPKKGLSQNFLIDGNIIRKIVIAGSVSPQDIILEIGPGPGALTQALLETGAHVIAVEKDTTFASALERLQTPSYQLEVFCDDILKFPFDEILKPRLQGKKAKVIANLPYHVTTPILAKLAPRYELFSSLTLMVQQEVAKRFTASPGNKDYGSFTVFLNFFSEPRFQFSVSRHCFYPPPTVESAIVSLELHPPPLLKEQEQFFRMTRLAFEQRRKMLRVSLKPLFPSEQISKVLEKIGQNPLARPEDLSLEDFLKLYENLKRVS